MLDLLGPGEIAELLNVAPPSVSRWIREGTLPPPDAQLKRIDVWERTTIVEWAEQTGRL